MTASTLQLDISTMPDEIEKGAEYLGGHANGEARSGCLWNRIPFAPLRLEGDSPMIEQNTRVPCVNRAERIRNRALLHVQRTADYAGYNRMVALSLEAHSIREQEG